MGHRKGCDLVHPTIVSLVTISGCFDLTRGRVSTQPRRYTSVTWSEDSGFCLIGLTGEKELRALFPDNLPHKDRLHAGLLDQRTPVVRPRVFSLMRRAELRQGAASWRTSQYCQGTSHRSTAASDTAWDGLRHSTRRSLPRPFLVST